VDKLRKAFWGATMRFFYPGNSGIYDCFLVFSDSVQDKGFACLSAVILTAKTSAAGQNPEENRHYPG
jgi:hypothetical protein